ncbi:HK97 family phage prohead protease [Sinorhizobium sp. 8-89]|uniref:HK97 family phage prohead protease n=1 Tax=Sinorhizobium sp. 7-81 TaxID=3049087 RepID=UPI0024C426A3|nr:HK97 family phage prohead protease [Sinorhizobium sp. 7-81]MDK1385115.1 HK97 family phage prohead protease [Sinorhizobium sp. 7-81]
MSHILKFDPTAIRLAPPLDLEVKAAGDGLIEGYASTFGGKPDRSGDIVAKGAFARTLAEHAREGTTPAMLWAHRIEEPIGKWTTLREDREGLHVAGRINLKTTRGREAFEHIAAGDAGAFSIGYLIGDHGRKYNGDGSYTLVDVDLVEVSIVAVPANPRARIASVKAVNSKAELVDLLHEAGLAKAAANRVAASGWAGLSGAETQEKAKRLLAAITGATDRLKGK